MNRHNLTAIIGLASLPCLGINAVWANPTVTNISQLSEKRISRTVFEYTYSATITNDATVRTNVKATLTGVGAGTSIVEGVVSVGALSANQTVTPSDTFTIRQDRTVPFNSSALAWNITFDDASHPEVSLFINPRDTHIASIKENGIKVDYYGEKDSDGLATKITYAEVYLDDLETTAHFFMDENGKIRKVIINGVVLEIDQLSETTAKITLSGGNGEVMSSIIDLTEENMQEMLPNTLIKTNSFSGIKNSSGYLKIPKTLNITDMQPIESYSLVNVEKCGQPVDDAIVDMLVITNDSSQKFHGNATQVKGTYWVDIPTQPSSQAIDLKKINAQYCAKIKSSFDINNEFQCKAMESLSKKTINTGVGLLCNISPIGKIPEIGKFICSKFSKAISDATPGLCTYGKKCDSAIPQFIDSYVKDSIELKPLVKIPKTFPETVDQWYNGVETPSKFAYVPGPLPSFNVYSQDASAIPPGTYVGPAHWMEPWDAPSKVTINVNEAGLVTKVFFHGHNVSPYIALPYTFEYFTLGTASLEGYSFPPETMTNAEIDYDCTMQEFTLPGGYIYPATSLQVEGTFIAPPNLEPSLSHLNVRFQDWANSFTGTATK